MPASECAPVAVFEQLVSEQAHTGYHRAQQISLKGSRMIPAARLNIAFSVVLFSATTSFAEKNADIPTVIAKRGDVTFHDDFSSEELAKEWDTIRGDWKIVDGAVRGKELKAEKHAAVFHCLKKNRNSIVRFSFKLDGAEQFHFSLNYKRGHLFRAIVSPTSIIVRTDHSKRDKSIKSEMVGKATGKFEQGKWYTMQIEMVGDKVAVQTDNGLKVEGSNERLDTDKPNYRFILKDEFLVIDDVTVWEAK